MLLISEAFSPLVPLSSLMVLISDIISLAILSLIQHFADASPLLDSSFMDFLALSLAMMVIVLLAALYPARFAARLEPVEALHAL